MTLPFDLIPENRRTFGDFTGRLGEHNGALSVALARWMGRDDSKSQPEIRQAGGTAMEAVDAMLAELQALRARLVSEIRTSDAAADARADALLGAVGRARPIEGGL